MKVIRACETNLAMRESRVWKLLAADKAPLVLAMLQTLFADDARLLPGTILQERLARDLDLLRAHGQALAQSASAYIADWLTQGWLTRRFPPGAAEEAYELSVDAVGALRILGALARPRTAATESRLATVMQQVVRLAEETDANPKTRLAALLAERERIDQEIRLIEGGGLKTLPADRALERAREIITLAQELAGDFRNVRDAFDRLNRELRQTLMENDGSRGEVLEHMFAGVDTIAESEPGRTFTAFWRLLTNGEQSATLGEALDAVTSREFAQGLSSQERKFLQNLTGTLMVEGGEVHEVLQQFARSLKSFVQSREFQEQRRLHSLIKQAQVAAGSAREYIAPSSASGYSLMLSSSELKSAAQWAVFDPQLHRPDTAMDEAPVSQLGLDTVEELVRNSEIDIRTLRDNIRTCLQHCSQATVADLVRLFPVEQGLGTVVGYLSLGAKHGVIPANKPTELVRWVGRGLPGADGKASTEQVARTARVPVIYFLREKAHEFHT